MKHYSQIISKMKNSLWLIDPDSLAMIVDIVNRRLNGEHLDDEEIRLRIENASNGDRENTRVEVGGGVGIVPMYGPIFPKSNIMTDLSGATSLETFREDLRGLLQNPKVESIVLDIDSPGGTSDMVAETADEIREAREVKPIIAVANTMAASAAYWIGAQATELYSTPSGKVGSIGVYTVHEDLSKQDEAQGRKVSFISAGDLKTAGNPHEPLSEEARTYIQTHVDELYETFVDAVAQGRNIDRDKVKTEFADGRVFTANQANEMGMINGIKSLDQVVDSLLAQQNAPVARGTLSSAMAKHHSATDTFTSDTTNIGSTASEEHAEPGTGNPPEPREQPSDLGATPRGSRRDTPPIVSELEEELMEELITKLRAAGIEVPEDATEDDLVTLVSEMYSELAPIREATASAEVKQAFRAQFPEEAERMERLEAKDRANEAHTFAVGYARFVKEGTDGQEKLTHGFSSLVIGKVEDFHLKLASRQATAEEFKEVLDLIANNGIVDYAETGSSRPSQLAGEFPIVFKNENPRSQFAELVQHYMTEDELDNKAAIKMAAEKHPEMFEAYRRPPQIVS